MLLDRLDKRHFSLTTLAVIQTDVFLKIQYIFSKTLPLSVLALVVFSFIWILLNMSSMLLIMQLIWLFFKKNYVVFITISTVSILPMFR